MLHYIFLFSVLVFFGVFASAFHAVSGKAVRKFLWMFLLILFLVMTVVWLLASYFSGSGVDQVVFFHLRYGVQGAGLSEYMLIIFVGIFLVLLASLVVWWVGRKWKRSKYIVGRLRFFVATIFLLFGIFLSLVSNEIVFDALEYHGGERNDFYDYYREPSIQSVNDSEPMNLVYIYAESFERTYFDEVKFPGLIKNLREFQKQSLDFSNIEQTPYAGWTIAGMVSSQCGLPLYTTFVPEEIEGMSNFMPRATCLGDLLKKVGYELAYFGGADLAFAGKGNFYRTHGFDWLEGKLELENELVDPNYQTSWGLYDDSLLQIAKRKFLQLGDKGEPFGFFALTLDTHHPYGHPSASCEGLKYGDLDNSILDSVMCSDYLLADFIQFVRDSEYGERTIIVLASDHLAMRNAAYYMLNDPEEDRRNLFLIFDPRSKVGEEIVSPGATLDIGATLLPFLGFEGDIGLGRNLLEEGSVLYDLEDGLKTIFDWEKYINSFWLAVL